MGTTDHILLCRNSDITPTSFRGGESNYSLVVDSFSVVLWGPWSLSGKFLIFYYLIPSPHHLKWASGNMPFLVADKPSQVGSCFERLEIQSGFNLKLFHSFLVQAGGSLGSTTLSATQYSFLFVFALFCFTSVLLNVFEFY